MRTPISFIVYGLIVFSIWIHEICSKLLIDSVWNQKSYNSNYKDLWLLTSMKITPKSRNLLKWSKSVSLSASCSNGNFFKRFWWVCRNIGWKLGFYFSFYFGVQLLSKLNFVIVHFLSRQLIRYLYSGKFTNYKKLRLVYGKKRKPNSYRANID